MSKRVRETPEIAAGVRRMVRALGRRVGDGDPVDLKELLALQVALDEALVEAVAMQHDGTGFSWAEIARELGTTRQAAQMRFGPKVKARSDRGCAERVSPTSLAV